ncbi:MAG: CDP-alcohol phosphatidyltransferase family protein [Longimicrobiales bacterium]
MALLRASALPNVITIGRVIMAPVVFVLIFMPGFTARIVAFVLFVLAAVSDLWDGYLARKHGWISDFGQLVDPIADKLLLVATLIPFYVLSHRGGPVGPLPWWGELPWWVLGIIFGRELVVTILRSRSARRGLILPAGESGKQKAVFQNIFIGSVLFWYALQSLAYTRAWSGFAWQSWQAFHAAVLNATLAIALFLTVYSFIIYVGRWRKVALREP